MDENGRWTAVRDFFLSYGLVVVMVVVFIIFSVSAPNFFTLRNVLAIVHTAVPLMIVASGLALVIMSGKIDISVGSSMFLSCGIGVILMRFYGVPSLLGVLVMVIAGALVGLLNGFIIVGLRVNPLIATMGTMITLRGLSLQITNSLSYQLPEELRRMGNVKVGPVYVDILAAAAVLIIVHVIHTRTLFGRHIMALGNGTEIAERLGVRAARVTYWSFILSGLFAAVAGVFSVFQVGSITPSLGSGYEFSAIALIVIGGISLFGGEGTIIPGLILGAITLTVIENGLNFVGASPYAYPFVRGAIIFIAMYADSLKSLISTRMQLVVREDEA
jgi:ribose/xylose/arabinose/galactoside ABC-type transport system permease subunit